MFQRTEIKAPLELPAEILNFIKKYNIKIINPANKFNRGNDMVFHFLYVGANADFYMCALQNMDSDKRFTTQMKNELATIIFKLADNPTKTIQSLQKNQRSSEEDAGLDSKRLRF